MHAAKIYDIANNSSYDLLLSQLDLCKSITGIQRVHLEYYLLEHGIVSLEEISPTLMIQYHHYVMDDDHLSNSQKRAYKNQLETFLLSYYEYLYPEIILQLKSKIRTYQTARTNKIIVCLMIFNTYDASDITYEIRCQIQDYLKQTIAISSVKEHIKILDCLKLDDIKSKNQAEPFKSHKYTFSNSKFFLLYHPDYEIACSFYFVRDKEELVFDFSLSAPANMKKQIFSMLNYILENKTDTKDRRERFLMPLKRLYLFCITSGITDIENLTESEIEAFRLSLTGTAHNKENIYMQIIDNICKYLFLLHDEINWEANIWFMERFHINKHRINPARPILSFSFREIIMDDNREHLKKYLKYLISLTDESIQNIRTKYYDIKAFFSYCDIHKLSISTFSKSCFDTYATSLDQTDLSPEYYNRKIINICQMLRYLKSKSIIQGETIFPDYYLKRTFATHHDRSIPEDMQLKILENLKYLPLHLRLMFLNLWCIGLRINEVCCITADAYSWDGETAWITIWQYKLRSEKRVPIPKELYNLMIRYIHENKLMGKDYVFQCKKGNAYDAGTFTKQMKQELNRIGITIDEYLFKAHDYRHTLATFLYEHGASIQTIRDYLGHNSEEMTKQYIDWIPTQIKNKSDEYFQTQSNLLHPHVKEGEANHENSY